MAGSVFCVVLQSIRRAVSQAEASYCIGLSFYESIPHELKTLVITTVGLCPITEFVALPLW